MTDTQIDNIREDRPLFSFWLGILVRALMMVVLMETFDSWWIALVVNTLIAVFVGKRDIEFVGLFLASPFLRRPKDMIKTQQLEWTVWLPVLGLLAMYYFTDFGRYRTVYYAGYAWTPYQLVVVVASLFCLFR